MTIAMLTFVIANFCQIDNKNIDKEQRIECINFMSNCTVIQDGKTTEKMVNFCKERWVDYERSNKER